MTSRPSPQTQCVNVMSHPLISLTHRWLGPTIPPNTAIQRLSYAVGTMNKILLPVFQAHASISEVPTGRKRIRHPISIPISIPTNLSGRPLHCKPTKGCANSSSSRSSSSSSSSSGVDNNLANTGLSAGFTGADVDVNEIYGKRKSSHIGVDKEIMKSRLVDDTPGRSPHAILLESCFHSWLDFIDGASELVAAEITTDTICDFFFKTKSGEDGNRSIRKYQNRSVESFGNDLVSDRMKSISSVSKNPQFEIVPVIGIDGGTSASSIKYPLNLNPTTVGTKLNNLHDANGDRFNDINRGEGSQSAVQDATYLKVPCNEVAVSFITGILSIEEASSMDEILVGQRAVRESKVQDLLQYLYSFPCRKGNDSCVTTPDQKVRTGPVLSRPVLSCPVLSCPVLSCPVLSCPVLYCLVLSCPVLSCPVLFCPVLSCPVLSCPVLSCLVLSCLVLSCLVLSCPDLSCPVLSCPVLS